MVLKEVYEYNLYLILKIILSTKMSPKIKNVDDFWVVQQFCESWIFQFTEELLAKKFLEPFFLEFEPESVTGCGQNGHFCKIPF